MKTRDYRDVGENVILHIFNRGNNKEKIFFGEKDYKAFLFRLGLALGFDANDLNKESMTSLPYSRIRINDTKKGLFKLHSFCLMPNHFHLLIEQSGSTPVSKLISKLCTSYAMYINKKYKRVGHVFQDQFKSVLVESDPQLMWISAYIHTNPVKDRLVKNLENYRWSSYNDYANNRNFLLVYKDLISETFNKKDFKKETLKLSE